MQTSLEALALLDEVRRVAESKSDVAVREVSELVRSFGDECATLALRSLEMLDDDYVTDHCRRLLTSALTGSPLQEETTERKLLHSRERDLEGMPLDEAYELLCRMEPRLLELSPMVFRRSASPLQVLAARRLFKKIATLVGPNASSVSDPLLSSAVSMRIAVQALLGR